MPNGNAGREEINLFDTLDRIRAEKFPHIPRDLVREILQLHADAAASQSHLVNEVASLVRRHVPEEK